MLIIIFFWYLSSIVCIALCENEQTPDITLLVTRVVNKTVNYTCVAGKNVEGTAITFISPIGINYKEYHFVSKYISNNMLQGKNVFDCDFEEKNDCKSNWIEKNVEIESSENGPQQFDYVVDERWEKFQVFTGHNINNLYKISENQFKVSLSIRAKEALILLCNDEAIKKCYWIVLNSNMILYCNHVVIKGKMDRRNSGCTSTNSTSNLKVKLSEKKWIHLLISKKSTEPNIKFENGKNMMFNLQDSESVEIKNMYVQLESAGYWKIHKYKYLSLNMPAGKWHDIGPELQPQNGALCIALYAVTCKTCTLSFQMKNTNKIIKEVKGNNQWEYVKIIHENASQASYKLQVKKEPADKSGFWYIDDIRQCRINEQRIISMTAQVNTNDTVSCTALKYPDWKSSNTGAEVGPLSNDIICNTTSYIGQNCNISCSTIFGEGDRNQFCNKHIICKSSKSKTTCSCAAGYYGDHCDKECPKGFYGYNCLKICDPCYNFCSEFTGKCNNMNDCETNKSNPGCTISHLYKMLAIPKITNSNLTSITVIPVINNKIENVLYQIQFKNDSIQWKNEGPKTSEIKETTIKNLTPLTKYKVRLVLFSVDGSQNTSCVHHIYSLAETKYTESTNIYYDNLKYNKSGNTLQITWRAISKANIMFYIAPKENIYNCNISITEVQIDTTTQTFTTSNLYPYINYELHMNVMKENATNETKTFNITEHEFPVLYREPVLINPTLHNITVQFTRKDIKNSNLAVFYEVQYKIGRKKWKSKGRENITEINNFTLSNLNKETLYYVRVVFNNEKDNKIYDTCVPTNNITTNCKDLSSYKLIKDFNIIPKEYEVIVKWEAVCNNNFTIIASCINSNWCNKSNNDTFGVNSLNEIYTIKKLIPFTNYKITLLVSDAENNDSEFKNITTLPAAPLAVRNFHVYSYNGEYISLRFQKPYPPHGILSNYEININETHYNSKSEKCELWEDYECITIPLNIKYDYINITITAINIDIKTKGKSSQLTLSPKNTEKPINITINNKLRSNNEIQLSWSHPNFTKGKLIGFVIRVKLLEISLVHNNSNFTEISETFNTTHCSIYNYELKHFLPPSSKYEISIQGENEAKELGEVDKIITFTSPSQPTLNGNISINEWTNYTQKINIPPLNQETLTKNSSMYLVICDPISLHGFVKKENNVNVKGTLKAWSNCTGVFWVASTFNVNKVESIFHFDENTEKLKLYINYTISVLVINEYNNEYNYSKYSFVSSAPKSYTKINSAFYLLFLLLLIIPVIGYFIYKQRKLNITETDILVQSNSFEMKNMLDSIFKKNLNRKTEHLSTNEQEQPLINQNENSIYTKLINVCNLSQYIRESLENGELKSQHALFPKGGVKSWDYGMASENKFKNRYNNLTAYDHSRVVLEKLHGDDFSDFINANYIDGYKIPQAYIATQGPKPSTVNDFWRMIWQENVKCIVMLANLVENEKQKCHQYWPSKIGQTTEYFNVSVTYLHSDIYADFEYRTFEAICNEKSRMIEQLHFTSWPDHGVPQYPQSLIPFVRRILAVSLASPIVVHCSAGVGRTGTIILCDICLRMAAAEQRVDVLKYIHSIREQRANLVDNFDQYKLVHMVLLECLLAPETSLTCDNLEENVNNMLKQGGLQQQIEYLKETAWHDQVMNIPLKLNDNYASKNRFPDIVPNVRRVYLSRYPFDDEYSDYINAVPIDGFRSKDQFIVTQTPLPHTVKDFWRMIFENNVKLIISLNKINIKDNTCCIFWPVENGKLTPVSYITLNYQSIKDGLHYDIYNIQIVNTSQNCETTVQIIQLKHWKREQIIPDDVNVFTNIIEEAQSLTRQEDPVVVTCYDGATASGLYVAFFHLIEKIKLEQICDVCQAVRAIRINRPQFISNRKQFEFLYNAAVQYVASFEGYSNFETFRKNK